MVSSEVTPETEPSPTSTLVTPADIRVIPVIPASSQSTRSTVATLISCSPYKAALEESLKKKVEREAMTKSRVVRKLSLTESTATGTVQQAKVKKCGRPKKNVQQVQPNVVQDNNSGDFRGAPAEDAGPSAVVQKKKQVEKLSTVIGVAGPSNAQKKERKKVNSAPLSSKKRQCKAPVRKTVEKKKIVLPSQILNSDSSNPDSDEEDAECQFCEHKYSKDQHGEKWISCSQCYMWAHEDCDATVEEVSSEKKYICSRCLN